MPNEFSNAPYSLVKNKLKNNSRIVIEEKPENGPRPPQKHWPPRVTDPNSYDRNVVDPNQQNFHDIVKQEPEKTT